MPDILLRGLSKWAVDRLRLRAKREGRSLQSELRTIVEREARMLSIDEALERARALRSSMPAGPADTTNLIREDRDR